MTKEHGEPTSISIKERGIRHIPEQSLDFLRDLGPHENIVFPAHDVEYAICTVENFGRYAGQRDIELNVPLAFNDEEVKAVFRREGAEDYAASKAGD